MKGLKLVDIKPKSQLENKMFQATIFLLVLSCFDTVFTDYGLRNEHITEANPLMRILYEMNIAGFYLVKIGLPLLLLYLFSKLPQKKYLNVLIITTIILYISVFLQHAFWISQVLIA